MDNSVRVAGAGLYEASFRGDFSIDGNAARRCLFGKRLSL